MLLLSDCVLAIDGERIPLSWPVPVDARPANSGWLGFGIAATDVDRLSGFVGRVGLVHTQAGIVVLRLRILRVDSALNVLTGAPARGVDS